MYSKFESLTEEKQKKIIDACIEEFSQNGYINASTNNIVRNAEISKGILFHYFGNKKSLYLYILDHVIDFLTKIMYESMTDLPADFFERTMKIGILKLKSAYEYPVEYKLLLDAYSHTPDELKQELKERYEKLYTENLPTLFNDIDTSKFRKDIDINKAMELITLAFQGLNNKYLKSFESMTIDQIMSELEKMTQDFNEYIEILKNGIYDIEDSL